MSFLTRSKPSFLEKKSMRQQEERLVKRAEQRAEAAAEEPERLRQFHERNRAEHARRKDATDSECWVAICFRNRADKDAFIAEFGLLAHPMIPGTPGNKYVDGYSLAEALRRRLA